MIVKKIFWNNNMDTFVQIYFFCQNLSLFSFKNFSYVYENHFMLSHSSLSVYSFLSFNLLWASLLDTFYWSFLKLTGLFFCHFQFAIDVISEIFSPQTLFLNLGISIWFFYCLHFSIVICLLFTRYVHFLFKSV